MIVKKLALALGTLALVSGPALAQVSMAPTVAPLTGEETGAQGSSSIIIGVVAAAAVIVGIVVLSDDDEAVSR